MQQVIGYLVSYPDTRTAIDELQIPDRWAEEIMLKYLINDSPMKANRRNVVCMTVEQYNPATRIRRACSSSLTSMPFLAVGRRVPRRQSGETKRSTRG